jgi:hypothetical protein
MQDNKAASVPSPRRTLWRRLAIFFAGVVGVYLLLAYVLVPFGWKRYGHRHPSLEDVPSITYTGAGIPGDPLNVALIGTREELIKVMLDAKWYPADPLTFRSSVMIAVDSVLKRPDDQAPVSNLYLFGRKEDLAFEQPVGNSPRHRHHVRFWETDKVDNDGRPVWVGSAVYDERVGLSRTTGQVTHVTAADVDAERDYLFQCLRETGELSEWYAIDDFHKQLEGRDGGGDPWHTDGRLFVGVISLTSAH